jgi:hypothetical protein
MPQFPWPYPKGTTAQQSNFWVILPYLEQSNVYVQEAGSDSSAFNSAGDDLNIKTYVCPVDASVSPGGVGGGYNIGSYTINGMVFVPGVNGNPLVYPQLDKTFPDGPSNTVLYFEHIALCPYTVTPNNNNLSGRNVWPATNLTLGDPVGYWPTEASTTTPAQVPAGFGSTAAGGSQGGFQNTYSTAMIPDPNNNNVMSFKVPQINPTYGPNGGTCDPTTASSSHPSGVLVGMGDGSVHSVGTISMKTWNALLTPAGGEVLGSDWSP